MTRKAFVIACCLLASGIPMMGQSRGTKARADPISGTWTGTLVLQGGQRTIPVTMTLKFDGKSAVSGVVSGLPNPAEVKAGTFYPRKGTLKLPLGKKSEDAVLLLLEGSVAKGVAAGHFTGDESGEFEMTRKM